MDVFNKLSKWSISLMTEPNFIILIDLDSRKIDLQNFILKITKNTGFKSKKNRSGPLKFKIKIQISNIYDKIHFEENFIF